MRLVISDWPRVSGFRNTCPRERGIQCGKRIQVSTKRGLKNSLLFNEEWDSRGDRTHGSQGTWLWFARIDGLKGAGWNFFQMRFTAPTFAARGIDENSAAVIRIARRYAESEEDHDRLRAEVKNAMDSARCLGERRTCLDLMHCLAAAFVLRQCAAHDHAENPAGVEVPWHRLAQADCKLEILYQISRR